MRILAMVASIVTAPIVAVVTSVACFVFYGAMIVFSPNHFPDPSAMAMHIVYAVNVALWIWFFRMKVFVPSSARAK
jgi:hypothetical protein